MGPPSRNRDTGELSKTNIYISGLKSTTTDEDLQQLCQSYGTIVSAKAIIDRELNHCKGYGFVMFEKESSAKAAVDALVCSGAQAAFAKVTRAQTEWQGRQEADPTNLYLTNLPKDMEEQTLTRMLLKCLDNFGEVVSCRVLRDDVGLSRGVGLARMDSRQACETIIKRLNGCVLPNTNEALRVKFANGPSPRKFKFLHREAYPGARAHPDGGNPGGPYDPSLLMEQGGPHVTYQPGPPRYMTMAPNGGSNPYNMHDLREALPHDPSNGMVSHMGDNGKAAAGINGSRLSTWVPSLGAEDVPWDGRHPNGMNPGRDDYPRSYVPSMDHGLAQYGHPVMVPEYSKMMPVPSMYPEPAGPPNGFFLSQ